MQHQEPPPLGTKRGAWLLPLPTSRFPPGLRPRSSWDRQPQARPPGVQRSGRGEGAGGGQAQAAGRNRDPRELCDRTRRRPWSDPGPEHGPRLQGKLPPPGRAARTTGSQAPTFPPFAKQKPMCCSRPRHTPEHVPVPRRKVNICTKEQTRVYHLKRKSHPTKSEVNICY